jgi:haloalkane dehalogenase
MSSAPDVYRTPDERFAGLPGYPFAPHYATLDGLRMHYVDEGSGEPVLLLHGEPTWSYLYRKIVPVLAANGLRAVAPDLVGFGRSDKPTELTWYSYERHVALLRAFVEELDLHGITLVVHDWGGPIGLRLATLDPKRIARLVILNTGIFTPWAGLPSGLRRWREYASTQPDLDTGALVSRGCAAPLPPEVVEAYRAPFPTRASKAGARAFPMLVPETIHEPGAREMIETVTHISELRYGWPTLVYWGGQDPIFPAEVGRYFNGLFFGSSLHVLPSAGHFVQEDAGPLLGERIVELVRSHW